MNNIHFALFDDHEIRAHALKKFLTDINPLKFIFKTHSKEELLEACQKETPHVLFVSYPFANKDSEDVIERARETFIELRILVLTHVIESDSMLKLIDDGANCILPSNATLTDLDRALKEIFIKEYCFTELFSQSMLTELKRRKVLKKRNNDMIKLSARKVEIINLLYKELNHKEIGNKMSLKAKSIDNYVTDMIHEVGARNVVGLIKYGMKNNLLNE